MLILKADTTRSPKLLLHTFIWVFFSLFGIMLGTGITSTVNWLCRPFDQKLDFYCQSDRCDTSCFIALPHPLVPEIQRLTSSDLLVLWHFPFSLRLVAKIRCQSLLVCCSVHSVKYIYIYINIRICMIFHRFFFKRTVRFQGWSRIFYLCDQHAEVLISVFGFSEYRNLIEVKLRIPCQSTMIILDSRNRLNECGISHCHN